MPIARFKGIFQCSSEDKNYPASNLVNSSNKKWKVAETGLDSAYVVLQLENPTKINGIDIGNENAAFIEVSVGRTGWTIENYKTILVASSFMTVVESRVSDNANRVRCFQKDALMPDVANEKWELVKITCTQSFNKNVQFGVSFIKIHTNDTISTLASASPSVQKTVTSSPKEKKNCDEALGLPKTSVFAKFRMRVDSTDSDNSADASTSLFSKWKGDKESPKKESTVLTTAAAIREASTSNSKLEECTKINRKIETPPAKSRRSIESDDKSDSKKRLNRYRPEIMYDDDDENTSNPRLEKLINDDKERIENERVAQMDKNKAKKDMSRDEKSKQKMESSADKFKTFLQKGVPGESSRSDDKPRRPSNAKAQSVQDDDDGDVVEVKTSSSKAQLPAKDDLSASASPEPSRSKSPDPTTPPAWKAKNKRASTANDGSASKRRRSTSPGPDSSDDNSDQLLRGVVFVISGIQNPDRADIRGKGLKMGAKYRPDWDNGCTHLICAFKNTPKYNQVQGSGIIVNKNWINECYAQKKKLPWQDYEL